MAASMTEVGVGIKSPTIDTGPRRLYDVVGETSQGRRIIHCDDAWVTDAFALWGRVPEACSRLAVDAPSGTYKVMASGLQVEVAAQAFDADRLLDEVRESGQLVALRWVGTSYRVSGNKTKNLLDDPSAVPLDRWEATDDTWGHEVLTPARYRFVLMNHGIAIVDRTVWITPGSKKVVVVREGDRISALVMPRRSTEPMCHFTPDDV